MKKVITIFLLFVSSLASSTIINKITAGMKEKLKAVHSAGETSNKKEGIYDEFLYCEDECIDLEEIRRENNYNDWYAVNKNKDSESDDFVKLPQNKSRYVGDSVNCQINQKQNNPNQSQCLDLVEDISFIQSLSLY